MNKPLLCSDYTMTMLKSIPTGVVPSNTADERLSSSLLKETKVTTVPCKVELQHEQVEFASYGIEITHPYGLYIQFPGEEVTSHLCFGLAQLVSYPSKYNLDLQKRFEIDCDIEAERRAILDSGMDISHNNLTDQILMGRLLYSWLPKPLPEGRNNYNGIRFFRSTEGNLPLGDYVFDVKWVMLNTYSYRFRRQTLLDEIGVQGNRYSISNRLVTKPPTLQVTSDFDRVTITLTKSSHHGSNSSVETNRTRSKKQKSDNGKDAPGPQLGM